MKNKVIKIFLILIINFNFFNFSYSDEFNFNVTEVQIYEGGNIIKGINGGMVTTNNNNIIIRADNFEYNKTTTLLKAKGNVILFDKTENITIESNEVFYEKDKELIYTEGRSEANNSINIKITADKYFKYNKLTSLLEAKGDVLIDDKKEGVVIETNEFFYLKNKEKFFTKGKTKAFIKNKYIINSKDLVFLRNQKLLSSNEKTSLEDMKLNNMYELANFKYSLNQEILKGKDIKVTTNYQKTNSDKYYFEKAFFNFKENNFLGKDVDLRFHKTLFDDERNDPRISSVIGYGDDLNTYFEKGVFTSCKKTDKCPPWKIKSNKIHHDKQKKQISYKHALLSLYNVPVFYFPKFFHPDPSVKRQSGFLKPDLGSSEMLGDSIYLPYFYVISKNSDITIKPRIFDNSKFLLQNEFRNKTKNSLTIADFSLTKGHNSSVGDRNDARTHFFANSKIDLGFERFNKSILEINYEQTSNDTYLKTFNLDSPLGLKNIDVLTSRVELALDHDDYDFITSLAQYETLGAEVDRYEHVLPSYDFSKNFSLKSLNGSFNFNSGGSNVLKSANIKSTSLTNTLKYNSTKTHYDVGIISDYTIALKNNNALSHNNPSQKSSPDSLLRSGYIYNTSFPLRKKTEKSLNTLIPKISFRFSPHEMEDNANSDRRMDIHNIYNFNRLGLGDFEGGESITVGLDFNKKKIDKKKEIEEIVQFLDFKIATVFRANEEESMPNKSTLNKKSSNIFGQFKFSPKKYLSLKYDFSLNNDLNYLEYNAISAGINFSNFGTTFDFLEERGIIGNANTVSNSTRFNFGDNKLTFKTRRDRISNLTEYYKILYEYKNDCLIAGLEYRKNYYNDADLIPLEELFFTITIIPLTTFSPDKMLLNKNRID